MLLINCLGYIDILYKYLLKFCYDMKQYNVMLKYNICNFDLLIFFYIGENLN